MTRRRAERGFTYVEVLLSVVVLAFAAAGMGLAVESSREVGADAAQMRTPYYLIQDGIAWCQILSRSDPETPASFGPEAGETPADYDDLDDLDGLVEAPVTDRNGEVFGADWARTFVVSSVDAANPGAAVADASSNLMRVRIGVQFRNGEVASEVALFWRIP